MNVWKVLTSNYIVNVGFTAWALAQILKTLFTLLFTKKLVLERMFGAGGMPSSHSALTTSIAIAMGNKLGFTSPECGLAFALAMIVMYDAMGVRRAAGEQAKVLNRIVVEFTSFPFFTKHQNSADTQDGETINQDMSQANDADTQEARPLLNKELKEFLGHTPLEVLGGCLLGILVSVFMPVI